MVTVPEGTRVSAMHSAMTTRSILVTPESKGFVDLVAAGPQRFNQGSIHCNQKLRHRMLPRSLPSANSLRYGRPEEAMDRHQTFARLWATDLTSTITNPHRVLSVLFLLHYQVGSRTGLHQSHQQPRHRKKAVRKRLQNEGVVESIFGAAQCCSSCCTVCHKHPIIVS